MGGIARLASIIKEKREKHPPALILDYGDSLINLNELKYLKNKDSAFKKARFILSTFSKLGYDGLNVGEAELACGSLNLKKWTSKSLKLISANILSAKDNSHLFDPYIIKNVDGFKYLITGIFPTNYKPYLGETIKKEKIKITEPAKELAKIIDKNKGKFDFVIVLSSMLHKDTAKFRDKSKNVTLIIGSKNFRRDIMKSEENPPIISNRSKLSSVSFLDIMISDKSKELVLIPEIEQIERTASAYEREMKRLASLKSSSPWKERKLKTLKERSNLLRKKIKTLKEKTKDKNLNTVSHQTVLLDKSIKDDSETRNNLDAFAKGQKPKPARKSTLL